MAILISPQHRDDGTSIQLPRSGEFGRTSAMFLDGDELAELTGRRRNTAQARALRTMGIEHRLRPDGSIAVLRAHVEKLFGVSSKAEQPPQNTEPDWSAI